MAQHFRLHGEQKKKNPVAIKPKLKDRGRKKKKESTYRFSQTPSHAIPKAVEATFTHGFVDLISIPGVWRSVRLSYGSLCSQPVWLCNDVVPGGDVLYVCNSSVILLSIFCAERIDVGRIGKRGFWVELKHGDGRRPYIKLCAWNRDCFCQHRVRPERANLHLDQRDGRDRDERVVGTCFSYRLC